MFLFPVPPTAVVAVSIVVVSLAILGCGNSSGDEPASAHIFPTPTPDLLLVADASNGVQQFVGGQTIPVGEHFFECGSGGNVSVQTSAPPYTVSMEAGDQTRVINNGDFVTVGWCKAWWEKSACSDFNEALDYEIALAGAVFELNPDVTRVLPDTFKMKPGGLSYLMQIDAVVEGESAETRTLTAHGVMDYETCAMFSLLLVDANGQDP